MSPRFIAAVLFCALFAPIARAEPHVSYRVADIVVVAPSQAPPPVQHAADELRRYAWLRTGVLPIASTAPIAERLNIILRTGPLEAPQEPSADPTQNHALYFEPESGGAGGSIVVHGASPRATLWAAYALIETWGVGFYLGGDQIPPRRPDLRVPIPDAAFAPTLAVRGSLPWLNFLNSPTTWNLQDYITFFDALARQKANLVMFHVYDHEPFCAYDISDAGATRGRPLMTTTSPHRWWSPHAMPTSDHLFGTDRFFERAEWGCEVGIEDAWGHAPGRAIRAQQAMFAQALAAARDRGLDVCLGFEVSGDPDDPQVRAEFERRLTHVLSTYRIDSFAIWQSEGLGTGGPGSWGARHETSVDERVRDAFAYLGEGHDLVEAARITKFVLFAHETLQRLAPDVRLVVSGWGGDAWFRFTSLYEGLDRLVPQDVVFAALDNIDPRLEPNVSSVYARVSPERECWPIPWFESDGGHTRQDQTGPQPNVTAFEPLLRDIAQKGCRGALGIHWRTRNVEDVAGYLLRFAWEPDLSAEAYLQQYARDHYGEAAARDMADVHLQLERYGPQYVGAIGCTECSTPFRWFAGPERDTIAAHGENLAARLPDESRLGELERLAADLMTRAGAAAERSDRRAAVAFHDLSQTITWLLTRARTGLAIAEPLSPLERRLCAAERMQDPAAAQEEAEQILAELESLAFERGLTALASTCRTRGELGMLATANARYGRFYAAFLARLEHLIGRPIPERRGGRPWSQEPLLTVMPVPGRIEVGQKLAFDVIAPGGDDPQWFVRIEPAAGSSGEAQLLPLARLRTGYHRAVLTPRAPGFLTWSIASESPAALQRLMIQPERGILSVTPAQASPAPNLVLEAHAGHPQPVLSMTFEEDPPGERIGAPDLVEARGGRVLDTRAGGFLRLPAAAEADFDGPFSIAFFVRPEPWQDRWPVILSKGDWAGAGWFVQLYGPRLRVGLGAQRTIDAPPPPAGEWSHIAVTHDGRELVVYLNAEPVALAPIGGTPGASTEPLRIGAYRDPHHPEHFHFQGLLDDIRLYDRPLSAAEVRTLSAP